MSAVGILAIVDYDARMEEGGTDCPEYGCQSSWRLGRVSNWVHAERGGMYQ